MRLLHDAVARALPLVPRPIVEHVSARYIAGPTLDDAVTTVRALNASGKTATIDVLGEEVTQESETRAIAAEYGLALAALDDGALDGNVSVKLTALGLELDRGLCRENLEAVVRDAAARGRFVRIDMEHSGCTDDTLALYRELRGAGLDNVGIVLQASLRRTVDDVRALADLRPSVRLCKGIYLEAEKIAYQHPDEVRDSFRRTLEALAEARCKVAVATHDTRLVDHALRLLRGSEPGYEFQVLLGVRERLADWLVADGHRLRVYVPYGGSWYAYSLRRLKENPRMATTVAGATLRRLVGRE